MLPVKFRNATQNDVTTLVSLLADDPLGQERESPQDDPLPKRYFEAFQAIDQDPNNRLLIAESEGRVAGFLQLTFIPYLTYRGRWRAMIESVRVNRSLRGRGVGRTLVEHAVSLAREQGCHVVQLTTDKRRPKALRFYESLGFRASHEGLKLHISKQ